MKPYLQRRVAWDWWQVELAFRASVRAAKALLAKDDLTRDEKAELALVLPDYYLHVESKLDAEETPTPDGVPATKTV